MNGNTPPTGAGVADDDFYSSVLVFLDKSTRGNREQIQMMGRDQIVNNNNK